MILQSKWIQQHYLHNFQLTEVHADNEATYNARRNKQ